VRGKEVGDETKKRRLMERRKQRQLSNSLYFCGIRHREKSERERT
jgi:hypothetical protein